MCGGAPFRIIGTDDGLIEAPVEATDVLLAPADRVDVRGGPFEEGRSLDIQSLEYNRGLGLKGTAMPFGSVVVGPAQPSVATVPERLRTIVPIARADAPARRDVRSRGRLSLRRGVDFMVNAEPHHHGQPVRVGELQVWNVINETPIDHPFHLHWFFFPVLEVNGVAPTFNSWEDTVNVPPKSTAKIAWMPDDRPGSWMAHRDILEHHAAGMMMHFEVIRGQSLQTLEQHDVVDRRRA